jgi:pseudouridine-5'-phosphate glycosidase
MPSLIELVPEVAQALRAGRPVVALESTLISHGLPWPENLQTAQEAEAAVREVGAVPATVAVIAGRAQIGLADADLQALARSEGVLKASRRDLGLAIARKQTASTTVAATMFLAHQAGIRLFATGGIGGVHRHWQQTRDISPDLVELARTPVCVVCSGAKAVLDLPVTLEVLETYGVPVLGFGTDEFPAFYSASSGLAVESRFEDAGAVAQFLRTHWELGGAGVVLAQPPPAALAVSRDEVEHSLERALAEAASRGVRGKAVTPFLLGRLSELTRGRTLAVNKALVVANARLGAAVAVEWSRVVRDGTSSSA